MEKRKFDDGELIRFLVSKIPEFKESITPEYSFSAYLIYGDFGIFLKNKVLENENIELIERSFNFLNNLIEEGDNKILQMLKVETLEILTDYDETINASKKYFKGDALKIFLEVVAFIKG